MHNFLFYVFWFWSQTLNLVRTFLDIRTGGAGGWEKVLPFKKEGNPQFFCVEKYQGCEFHLTVAMDNFNFPSRNT